MERTAPLERVRVSENVIQACLAHAFTTEQEEVMGVLLGEVTVHYNNNYSSNNNNNNNNNSTTTTPNTVSSTIPVTSTNNNNNNNNNNKRLEIVKRANVWDSMILQRSVRRSDRVEIAPELLANATEEAEKCSIQVGRHTRVIGWYHSHPRITPFPSQVDLNSQASYQMLESGWVGLIFSVFYTDAVQKNGVSIHCFQTGLTGSHEKIEMEIVSIMHMNLKALPPCEVMYRHLRVFREEIKSAVELVRGKCHNNNNNNNNNCDAMIAAYALQEVQLYTLHKLITQPALMQLKTSISILEKEVKRLEKELSALR